MPVPLTLGMLKQGLRQLLSISTHWFRIQYGGKKLIHDCPLQTQGIRNNVTVWLTIGGADTSMGDTPSLPNSTVTPIRRPTPTHSKETQVSIDEWIDRLRTRNPLS